MPDCIPYRDIRYFSDLVCDYLDEKKELCGLYNNFPDFKGFEKQILEKSKSFPKEYRKILLESLKNQYKGKKVSNETAENLNLLSDENTFTITTGHQLNLFTGPLYFLYKIVSAINLAKALKKKFPKYNFVPVYWMANEDHDFEEIGFFNFKGKKIEWKTKSGGAVGDISTEGLDEVFDEFSTELDASENADFLRQLFEKTYLNHKNLTEATFYLANELLGKYGIICMDAHRPELKKLFVPHIKNELSKQSAFENTRENIAVLEKLDHKIQVNPREINLFYLDKKLRERIVRKNSSYYIKDTDFKFSEKEILDLAEKHPERFSPNAIMRPLYQECILPNLCYIGGGAEIAYWLELKKYFEAEKIPFPILLLRNSALLVSEKQAKKLEKLNVPVSALFLEQTDLLTKHTKRISEIDIDFSPQKKHLEKQFRDLYDLAEKTDKSFLGAVAAQEKKQLNGLGNLEKRLLKAQKRKLKDELERLKSLQNQLFPKQNLQERQANFSEFYLEYGEKLIPILLKNLEPLNPEFTIITL